MNGQVERANSTIVNVLAKITIDDPTSWFKHVGAVQRVMNSTYHRSIKKTPFELLTGVKMRSNSDLEIVELLNEEIVEGFEARRNEVREDAKTQILGIQEENKRSFDKHRRLACQFQEGDIVAIKRI